MWRGVRRLYDAIILIILMLILHSRSLPHFFYPRSPSLFFLKIKMTQQKQQQLKAINSSVANEYPQTFYRRQLPPTTISFSSQKGKEIFASAMSHGGTYSFFSLIEQLQTQSEPAYCGLTTLVIVLNALAVDPRKTWKGPWRWYEESMLNCCLDLEKVKETGITFNNFACLAKCQGLDVDAVYGSNSTVDNFRQVVKKVCSSSGNHGTEQPASFLIVSYMRKVIGQTGTGHFSPIAAYDEVSDHILLLDTARFKYGPHWIPLNLMFEALLPLDESTGRSRGYMVLSYHAGKESRNEHLSNLPLSVLFRSKTSTLALWKEYKQFLNEQKVLGDGMPDLRSVVSFWTEGFTNDTRVWDIIEPQIQPVEPEEIEQVNSIRAAIIKMISVADDQLLEDKLSIGPATTQQNGSKRSCCLPTTSNISQRFLQISPIEAIFMIYLASLAEKKRWETVYKTKDESTMSTSVFDQLLAEAALLSYAIDTIDLEV